MLPGACKVTETTRTTQARRSQGDQAPPTCTSAAFAAAAAPANCQRLGRLRHILPSQTPQTRMFMPSKIPLSTWKPLPFSSPPAPRFPFAPHQFPAIHSSPPPLFPSALPSRTFSSHPLLLSPSRLSVWHPSPLPLEGGVYIFGPPFSTATPTPSFYFFFRFENPRAAGNKKRPGYLPERSWLIT